MIEQQRRQTRKTGVATQLKTINGQFLYTHCYDHASIDRFTVACLVGWPLNESEAGVDLALIGTSLLFLC